MADRISSADFSYIIDPLPAVAKKFLFGRQKLYEFAPCQMKFVNLPDRERQLALRVAFWEKYEKDLTVEQKHEFENMLTADERIALSARTATIAGAPTQQDILSILDHLPVNERAYLYSSGKAIAFVSDCLREKSSPENIASKFQQQYSPNVSRLEQNLLPNEMPARAPLVTSARDGRTAPIINIRLQEKLTRKLAAFPKAWRGFLDGRKLSQDFITRATDAEVKECDLPGYYLELRRSISSYRGAPLTLDDPSGDLNEALGWKQTNSELKRAAQAGEFAELKASNERIFLQSLGTANVFDYAACCPPEKREAVLAHLMERAIAEDIGFQGHGDEYIFEIIGSISALGESDGDRFDECVYSVWRKVLTRIAFSWGETFLKDIVRTWGGGRSLTARYLIPLSDLILESMLDQPKKWRLTASPDLSHFYGDYRLLMFGGEAHKRLNEFGARLRCEEPEDSRLIKDLKSQIRRDFSNWVSEAAGFELEDLKRAASERKAKLKEQTEQRSWFGISDVMRERPEEVIAKLATAASADLFENKDAVEESIKYFKLVQRAKDVVSDEQGAEQLKAATTNLVVLLRERDTKENGVMASFVLQLLKNTLSLPVSEIEGAVRNDYATHKSDYESAFSLVTLSCTGARNYHLKAKWDNLRSSITESS